MHSLLQSKMSDVELLCQTYNVKELYAFGSILGNDFNDESDLQFFITFPDDLRFDEYMDNYFYLHIRFCELFSRQIDIITEKMLTNPHFYDLVNGEKELIYKSNVKSHLAHLD